MRFSIFALALCILSPTMLHAGDQPYFEDAPLRAVRFVDANEGWAVGDEGAIWHTIDGGKTWERQPSGTRATLCGLHFTDPFTGYVVGRESLPHGTGSSGILLATRDGGVKWHRVRFNALPGLRWIKFFDAKTGFMGGDTSDEFPSGIFSITMEDGGITWKAVEGQRYPGWLAADFLSSQMGVLGGAWNNLSALRQRDLLPAQIDPLGGRTVRAAQYCGSAPFAVGDGGLALVSNDPSGKRWGHVELGLPRGVRESLDFHALAFAGNHGWMVGRPGSVVLHTADKGQTWQVQKTGQALPLHGLCFLDEKHGWAVGDLGTILATEDGGATWKVQQRGGHRAALLTVSARADGFPAGTVAVCGADVDEGYLCAGLCVTCADPASAAPGHGGDEARFAEAVRSAGGCAGETLWQFPLPLCLDQANAVQLARHWGHSNDEARGLEALERQIVLALRTWRPDVVVTDHPDPRTPSGQAGAMVALAVKKAIELAGQADAFPEQLAQLDLHPWTVKKLYSSWETIEGAQVAVDWRSPRPGLAGSAFDYCAPALALLGETEQGMHGPVRYHLTSSALDGAEQHKWLMQGLSLEPNGQARRERRPSPIDEKDWPRIQRAAQQRRDVQAIAKLQTQDPVKAKQLLGHVEQAIAGLSDEQAGETAFALGNLYVRVGQWLMAKEVFLLLVDRFPTHRHAPAACRWLIQLGSSSEARRREELKNFMTTTSYAFQSLPDPTNNGLQQVGVKGQQLTMLLRRQDEIKQWHKSSLVIGDLLSTCGPVYYGDPSVQFCLRAAERSTGQDLKAQQWFANYKAHHRPGDPWSDAAAAEIWLNRRTGQCPKASALCSFTGERPYLDGKLDEACWKDVKPIVFQDAVGQTSTTHPTEAWLAYDNEFLYLALRCKHPAGGRVPPVTPRRRDADLRDFDHVGLMLDLDRNYSTYFHFQVDQRGCVCDDCWGDKNWNPNWYVAVQSDETSWQIEAAIPLSELTGDTIRAGQAWCCNLVRTIPGQGVQAMSVPADAVPRPEGMGLLLFSDAPTVPPSTKTPRKP